ncbi:MAG: hypothetical protein JSW59_07480, partial [Phycisphaerales bacterium]
TEQRMRSLCSFRAISDISSLTGLTNLTWLELQGNYLYMDPAAYSEHLPLIKENNPAELIYDTKP